MFMRTVHLRLDTNRLLELRQNYTTVVIPALSRTPGCVYAGLLQSVEHPDLGISLTLWNSASDAEAYENTGTYQKLLEQSRPVPCGVPRMDGPHERRHAAGIRSRGTGAPDLPVRITRGAPIRRSSPRPGRGGSFSGYSRSMSATACSRSSRRFTGERSSPDSGACPDAGLRS